MILQYSMNEQEYTLPETASNISGEEEIGRIRWLATYSRSDTLFEAAKALLQAYERKTIETAIGPLVVPALVFGVQLHRGAFVSIPKLQVLRDVVVAQLVESLQHIPESMTDQQRSTLLQAIQNVLNERSLDGLWWSAFETEKKASQEFDAYVQGEYRNLARRARRG